MIYYQCFMEKEFTLAIHFITFIIILVVCHFFGCIFSRSICDIGSEIRKEWKFYDKVGDIRVCQGQSKNVK